MANRKRIVKNMNLQEQAAEILRRATEKGVSSNFFFVTTFKRYQVQLKLLEELEPGDTLVVTKLDRFARTASEGSALVKELLERGIAVHILNMGLIENTPTGRLILNVLLSFAEFERDMIVERTSEGKALARATNPDYKEGRKALEIPEDFEWYRLAVGTGEITVTKACEELGISRSTWYKWSRS